MGVRPMPTGPPDPTQRFAFLVEAGETLASSLDYEQTLREVARLAVRVLGDLCMVDVVEDGALRRVATAHVSPAKAELAEELRRRSVPGADSPQPVARVLRSGRPELLAEVTPADVAAQAPNADHADVVLRLGVRSYLAVPLVARGAVVGVIGLGITESDRRYDAQDLAFAMDLARRMALAVDNARLYRAAQDELAQRRRSDEALRISEARFRAMFEQSPLSTQIFRADGVTLRVNRAWEELWGLTLEHLRDYNVLHDPQLEARGIASHLHRAAGGEPVEIPAIRYDPDESLPDLSRNPEPTRWVRGFAYPVKDADGKVCEVVLIHENVTGRVLADERLRVSEERLRMALQGARMNVWDWDLETDRIVCSENARDFWGIEVGQAADFAALVHPDDRARLTEIAGAAASAGDSYQAEYRLATPDGSERWVQSFGRIERGKDGVATRILGVTTDISDRKVTEAATAVLADAGKTLGASLDAVATLKDLARVVVPRLADWCAIDMLDDAGALERVCVVNSDPTRIPLAMELFEKYPPQRGSPHGAWHVIETGQPEWVGEIDDEMMRAGARDPAHYELVKRLALRSYVCVPLVARGTSIGALTLVHAESNRRYVAADVAIATDLARRAAVAVENARLYERLREEDRRKDEFLATLAHELRNPLAPVRTGLDVLRTAPAGAATERVRAVMERQIGHMTRLIDDLLDVSRVTRGQIDLQLEPLDIAAFVAAGLEASTPVIEAAGLELTVQLPDVPAVIRGDRTRLSQVMSNLMNNAAKFTPRGGKVTLAVTREGPDAVLRLRDTGVGIPRRLLARVFEMFVQVERQPGAESGLGIGLTLARRLVELHGGRVWAESDGPGRGTTMVIRLPLAAPSEQQGAALGPPSAGATTARRVLVVDDNEDAAEMLEMFLTLGGHEVCKAASAEAALDVLRDFRPHVAFLDIGLPGMDGLDLAREIRKLESQDGVMLVAVTGWGQAEDRKRTRDAGFDHHLTKPVATSEIEKILEAVLTS
jgi:PAS domain S-box-containing protein